jgi:hypothetical protein
MKTGREEKNRTRLQNCWQFISKEEEEEEGEEKK